MLNKTILNFNFYQSANETDCSIIKQNFIVRTKDFGLIQSDLINDDMQGSVQHFLILGRRGSGKSTLLKRIECEVEINKELKKKFAVINLAEEQGGIHRLFDLWEEVIRILKEDGFENLPNTDDLDIPEDYGEYSRELFSKIQDAIRAKNKKLLLLIDNVDKIFLGFKNDAQILRETLLNFDDIKIIGGSTKMSEHFWQYDMPFYQFFRVLRLEALNKKDIEKLLMHWSELLNEKEIETFIKNNPGQIETIRILTDGLPRTLQFFIDLLINRPQQNGYSYIKKIMDRMTPLYQERLGSLQAVEQKIVMKLAFFWEAVSVKDLVKPTKIESKLLSANLKRLSDIGIVEKIATGKKNHLYRLSERFFNMWLIVTQGNPAEKKKAKWLTVFLENWYNKQDLKKLIHTHIEDLKTGTKDADHLSMFTKSLAQSKYTSFAERDMLIDETLKLKSISPHLKDTLPEKSSEILNNIQKLINKGNYDDALYQTNKISNEVDGVKENAFAYIHKEKQEFMEAEEYYKKAINKGNITALNNLAHIYFIQNKFEVAEKYCKIAIEKGDKDSLYNLALLYHKQNRLELTEEYYKKAIKNDVVNALNNLAILYDKQNNLKLAEKYYIKAIEKGNINALNNLAILYDTQNNLKLAEKYYIKASDKGDINALYNLAILYQNQNKLELAEKYYNKAIKRGHSNAFNNLLAIYYFKASNKSNLRSLIKQFKITGIESQRLNILIKFWLGDLKGIYEEVKELSKTKDAIDEVFIEHLLIHRQINLVWELFNNAETGQELKDKYKPLYYACSFMLNDEESNKNKLKLPPEIKATVYDIITKIEEQRKLYYK